MMALFGEGLSRTSITQIGRLPMYWVTDQWGN